jgi:hypothetical protein
MNYNPKMAYGQRKIQKPGNICTSTEKGIVKACKHTNTYEI